jgi:hypothetical protein
MDRVTMAAPLATSKDFVVFAADSLAGGEWIVHNCTRMRRCVPMAIVFGGLAALGACSSGGDGQAADDAGAGAASDGVAPPQDAGGGTPDAAVHGKRVDAGTALDASVGGIDAGSSVKVKWGRACWEVQNGQRFQAINFDLTTSAPVPLEATLFFTTKCDNSQGTENFNDVGATITSGSYAYWFIHHPDDTNTSATWSVASETTGCVDYQHAPSCH